MVLVTVLVRAWTTLQALMTALMLADVDGVDSIGVDVDGVGVSVDDMLMMFG